MKIKGLKTIAAVTAVSAGVLFAGANSTNASTRVTVQSGDTVSKLAKTYNVSMQSIKDANKIQDINKIYVGEVFDIDNGDVEVVSPVVAAATTDTDQTTTPAVTATAPVATAPVAQTGVPAAPAVQATAPVSQNTDTTVATPVAQTATPAAAPVQQAAAPVAQATTQPAATVQTSAPATSSVSGSDAAAKDWIAGRESGGNYGASNGQYVGKYQLSASYLNGDYSPANQEKVADNYVTSRYGSWSGAQAFWQANGWY